MKSSQNSIYTKKQLLSWINNLLKVEVQVIEDLSNGAYFCLLLDMISQGSVKISKVNWSAKLEHQSLSNLKVLSTSMLELEINKTFDATRIAQKKSQDILELLQWFRKFFLNNYKGESGYDPVARQRKSLSANKNIERPKSIQNNEKCKKEAKKVISSKKAEEHDIIEQSQLVNCYKANKQIQKIISDNKNQSAEKKLQLIRNILFNKSRVDTKENALDPQQTNIGSHKVSSNQMQIQIEDSQINTNLNSNSVKVEDGGPSVKIQEQVSRSKNELASLGTDSEVGLHKKKQKKIINLEVDSISPKLTPTDK